MWQLVFWFLWPFQKHIASPAKYIDIFHLGPCQFFSLGTWSHLYLRKRDMWKIKFIIIIFNFIFIRGSRLPVSGDSFLMQLLIFRISQGVLFWSNCWSRDFFSFVNIYFCFLKDTSQSVCFAKNLYISVLPASLQFVSQYKSLKLKILSWF